MLRREIKILAQSTIANCDSSAQFSLHSQHIALKLCACDWPLREVTLLAISENLFRKLEEFTSMLQAFLSLSLSLILNACPPSMGCDEQRSSLPPSTSTWEITMKVIYTAANLSDAESRRQLQIAVSVASRAVIFHWKRFIESLAGPWRILPIHSVATFLSLSLPHSLRSTCIPITI